MPETDLAKDIAEIKTSLAVINEKLSTAKELKHEERLRHVELWKARQTGIRTGVQWVINLLVGLAGILIGKFL